MYSLDDLCNTRSGALGPALRFCPPFFKAIIFIQFQCMNSFPQINHFSRPGSCERLSSLSGTICNLFFCHVHIMCQPLQLKINMYWLNISVCNQARAFICEGCHSKQPVFPFQVSCSFLLKYFWLLYFHLR